MPRVGPIRRLGLVLGALALTACSPGGGATERSEDAPTTTGATETTADATQATDPVPGVPTLRLGLVGSLSLDPAAASPASASAMALADLVHDTLTELDADGVPQRGLADFVPADDLTSWRFTLVEGATFADGSPIEADDVVATLERIRAQGGASLGAIALEDVTSVAAVDPRTVEVALGRPSAELPATLSSPLYGIIDRERPPGAPGAPANPSGDHRIGESSAERIVLERREGSGPARVVVRLLADDEAAHAAFVARDVDWAPVPSARLAELGDGTDASAPFHATVLLGMRTPTDPLLRPPLRQALALAVDRAAIAATVFGVAAQPAIGLVPAGVPGAADACVGPCGPDVERARQLVAQAFPDGPPPPLRLLTDRTSSHEAIARLLGDQLDAVGLRLEVEAVDPPIYAARLAAGQEQLFLTSSLGIARTPASHLLPWTSDSPDNLTGHRNELVDAAIGAAVADLDPVTRRARWREIEAALLADAPVVPLVQLRTAAAVREGIEGLVVRADGSLDLSGVVLPGG